MTKMNIKKLSIAGVFCAVAVVGSLFSFPVFGSKCAPVQHMINILCAVLLGPGYGVGVAFGASLIRNLLGLGSLMAFPGSMFGALLCGLAYKFSKNIRFTVKPEIFSERLLEKSLAQQSLADCVRILWQFFLWDKVHPVLLFMPILFRF